MASDILPNKVNLALQSKALTFVQRFWPMYRLPDWNTNWKCQIWPFKQDWGLFSLILSYTYEISQRELKLDTLKFVLLIC